MPFSDPDGKPAIVQMIRGICAAEPDAPILDVGPGAGTYAQLLKPHGITNLEAVEIFAPYVERYNLRSIYRAVHVADICGFVFQKRYRIAILGDVLEHIAVPAAQQLVQRLRCSADYSLFSVPWTYPQGVIDGNEHERHEQSDLTPEKMSERYPALIQFYQGPVIGLYYLRS